MPPTMGGDCIICHSGKTCRVEQQRKHPAIRDKQEKGRQTGRNAKDNYPGKAGQTNPERQRRRGRSGHQRMIENTGMRIVEFLSLHALWRRLHAPGDADGLLQNPQTVLTSRMAACLLQQRVDGQQLQLAGRQLGQSRIHSSHHRADTPFDFMPQTTRYKAGIAAKTGRFSTTNGSPTATRSRTSTRESETCRPYYGRHRQTLSTHPYRCGLQSGERVHCKRSHQMPTHPTHEEIP